MFCPTEYPVPHWYIPPGAKIPPNAVSVIALPLQTVLLPEIEVGVTERVATLTSNETPAVALLHWLLCKRRTQYVVDEVGLTYMVLFVCPASILEPITVPVPHWKTESDEPLPPPAANVVPPPL